MPRGGSREGAGRPALPPDEKAKMAAFKLRPDVIALIKSKSEEMGVSQAQLVTMAVEELAKWGPSRQ